MRPLRYGRLGGNPLHLRAYAAGQGEYVSPDAGADRTELQSPVHCNLGDFQRDYDLGQAQGGYAGQPPCTAEICKKTGPGQADDTGMLCDVPSVPSGDEDYRSGGMEPVPGLVCTRTFLK